ncbi:hypothetical protein L1987_17343 [Smallanthus sonchifolius]|uniref:Uncharacterized protein n=1 Tax=Smallanthus sonchifolius TaxID=185202 RepID=A0ACB9IX01_9ASTR|nr:hypothetical protein L1987_17343 [Smallanthus sonchifolius]
MDKYYLLLIIENQRRTNRHGCKHHVCFNYRNLQKLPHQDTPPDPKSPAFGNRLPLSIVTEVTRIELQKSTIELNCSGGNILKVNNAAGNGLIYVDDKRFKDGGAFMQVSDEIVDLLTGIIEEPYALGEECLNINYYGTKRVTEALVPLLQFSKSARIVNVSSAYGDLHWFHNDKLKQELHDIENLTEERIDEIIQWFLKDFKAAKLQENGWPLTASAYKVSKAAVNTYTRRMARKFQNMLVNVVHPGYVVQESLQQKKV